jgi:hypothetical protein
MLLRMALRLLGVFQRCTPRPIEVPPRVTEDSCYVGFRRTQRRSAGVRPSREPVGAVRRPSSGFALRTLRGLTRADGRLIIVTLSDRRRLPFWGLSWLSIATSPWCQRST